MPRSLMRMGARETHSLNQCSRVWGATLQSGQVGSTDGSTTAAAVARAQLRKQHAVTARPPPPPDCSPRAPHRRREPSLMLEEGR